MANRIMLNQTSYHGAGAIAEIATEAKAHGFKKALVCSDPDLIKFNVTSKVTDILDKEGLAYEIYLISKQTRLSRTYSTVYRLSKIQVLITLSQSAADLLWILPKQSVSSSQTRNLKM